MTAGPGLTGVKPEWASDLIGMENRGIEIIDVRVQKSVVGDVDLAVKTKHKNSTRHPYRVYRFGHSSIGWTDYTVNSPEICSIVMDYLEKENPELSV